MIETKNKYKCGDRRRNPYKRDGENEPESYCGLHCCDKINGHDDLPKDKVKRLVLLEIIDCGHCPWHEDSDGIQGSARWCSNSQNGKNGSPRQITGEDYSMDFPSWCPLLNAQISGGTPSVEFGCSAWTDCSDALPSDMESVLVVSRQNKYAVMHREREVWVYAGATAMWQPTHWMLLPLTPNSDDI